MPAETSVGFRPRTPEGAKAFVITPFTSLARAHAVSAMADAMVAASLAGSLFFSLPADNAREAAVVDGLDVYPVATLAQAVSFLNEQLPLEPYELDGEAYQASKLAPVEALRYE